MPVFHIILTRVSYALHYVRTPTTPANNAGSKSLSFHNKSNHHNSILVNSLLILEGQ